MKVPTADDGDTGWLWADGVEDIVVTESPEGTLLKRWPGLGQVVTVERATDSEIWYELETYDPAHRSE